MKIQQRKKDIERKLEYIGVKKQLIKQILSYHYSLLGRLNKQDIKLENLVNYHYNEIHATMEECKKIKIKLMNNKYNFQEIFYN